jgi:hypothetical protein
MHQLENVHKYAIFNVRGLFQNLVNCFILVSELCFYVDEEMFIYLRFETHSFFNNSVTFSHHPLFYVQELDLCFACWIPCYHACIP